MLRPIAQGGMGALYEARHVLIDKRVAIKVPLPKYAGDEQIMERLHREAFAAARAGNEHIIDVTDMGKLADGGWFLVLELLEGRDLAADLRVAAPPPLARIAHIAGQICEALSAAHGKGIVHRDLKPENVYLIRRGTDPDFVKVLDFGIAKILDGLARTGAAETAPQAVFGTPEYMAPEQMEATAAVDARADLYALGVILFEALTGDVPFRASSQRALMLKVLSQAPPRLRDLRPDLPPDVCDLVVRLLEKDPRRRPQSSDEVRHVLSRLAGTSAQAAAQRTQASRSSALSSRAPVVTAPPPSVTAPLTDAALGDAHAFRRRLRRTRVRWAAGALVTVSIVFALALLTRREAGSSHVETGTPLRPVKAARSAVGQPPIEAETRGAAAPPPPQPASEPPRPLGSEPRRAQSRARRPAAAATDNRGARNDGALEREARIEPSGAVQVPYAEPATLSRPHPATFGASAEPEQDTSELLRMPL